MTLKSFLISAITNMSLGERTMNHTFVALIKFYHSFLASYFSLFLCRLTHLTQNLLKITNESAGNASPRINSFLAPRYRCRNRQWRSGETAIYLSTIFLNTEGHVSVYLHCSRTFELATTVLNCHKNR